MSLPPIQLRGARVHNLKQVDVDIPRGKLVVICGVSGSGKTSLAFDTLYAEGQRRFIESFSTYTRQYLERLDKPEYDRLSHLPPAIAIGKQNASKGHRSTVGTASELNDFLRLLYARCAQLVCPVCDQHVIAYSPESVAAHIETLSNHSRITVCFSFTWNDRTDLAFQLNELQQNGFMRLIVDEKTVHLARDDRQMIADVLGDQGNALVAVDRLTGGQSSPRAIDSLETAFHWGKGKIGLFIEPSTEEIISITSARKLDDRPATFRWFTRHLRCPQCDLDFPDADPRLFSFNSPLGACPECEGWGSISQIDMNLVVPDPSRSLRQGAIACWNTPAYQHELEELIDLAPYYSLPLDIPFCELTAAHLALIQHGVAKRSFGGLDGFFAWLDRKKYKMHVRVFASRWKSFQTCPSCRGNRLKPVSLAYRIANKNFAELCQMEIQSLADLFVDLKSSLTTSKVTQVLHQQIFDRLRYLQAMGLGYLSIDRPLRDLSSGEAQRVALTSCLGSNLVSMLYVLDEPTMGLHASDTAKLRTAMESLRDRGNSVIAIEHDESVIHHADWVIELGPEAGAKGGCITFQGEPKTLLTSDCLTGQYLSGRRGHHLSNGIRKKPSAWLKIIGAKGNNLKSIDVDFPLGVHCVVTGVSGSGKSTLVYETLLGATLQDLGQPSVKSLAYDRFVGSPAIEEIIAIDPDSVSRSARSNAATYLKILDEIRIAFAGTIDAKASNLTTAHFSFNHQLGRCTRCEGDGCLTIDMQFMADVRMTCPDCKGKRYRSEVLRIKYRDRSIADVLDMTAQQALEFFRAEVKLRRRLQVLCDVGLDYLPLGQSTNTLSSGENQRLRLAGFLSSTSKKKTLFLLDEPTTGLHFSDTSKLIDCFRKLVEAGHSLIMIEHNLQMILAADYVIDLGPGASHSGGEIVAKGTPEEIILEPRSSTGEALKSKLR